MRRLDRWLVAAAASLAAAAALAGGARHAAGAATLDVRIDAAHPGAAVPRRFLGLSFEARNLPQLGSYATSGDMTELMRSLGPGVMRFGGNTVDADTAWVDARQRRPRWATRTVGAGDLARLAQLARATGWQTLLAVTLGHDEVARAADEAASARAALGPRLSAIEIGNEPDQYVEKGLRARPWNYARYRRRIDAYRRAIATAAGPLPLAGPDLASASNTRWISSFAADERPVLLTAHYYPLSNCDGAHPTMTQLLSARQRALETRTLDRLASLARRLRLPLRIGETNNISCSGRPGVSDTFGSALWALDYIVRVMQAGLAGVNFHDAPGSCLGYSPICASTHDAFFGGRLGAQPEWYALLLARELVGGRLLPVSVTPAPPDVTVAALRSRGGRLQVVAIDLGAHAVRIRLAARPGSATVLRLTAPALLAHRGVRLGGTAVAGDGSWTPGPLARAASRGGSVSVDVGGDSAALVTLP